MSERLGLSFGAKAFERRGNDQRYSYELHEFRAKRNANRVKFCSSIDWYLGRGRGVHGFEPMSVRVTNGYLLQFSLSRNGFSAISKRICIIWSFFANYCISALIMKKICFFSFLFFFGTCLNAQSLSGAVIDSASHQPLTGATVFF